MIDRLTFLFVTRDGLADKLIRMIDGGHASHVGIELPTGQIVDSTFLHGGVQWWTAESFMRDRVLVDRVTFEVPHMDMGLRWMDQQYGKPYDWTALVTWLVPWANFEDEDSWYCSELAVALAMACGKPLAGDFKRIGVDLAHKLARAWAD